MNDASEQNVESEEHPVPHYYGDIFRSRLLTAGVVLLLAIITDRQFLYFYLIVGVFGALALTILAGLTSPTNRTIVRSTVILSAILFVVFEYFAVYEYLKEEFIFDFVFILRQTLALIFISIVYLSTKTLRNMPQSKIRRKRIKAQDR